MEKMGALSQRAPVGNRPRRLQRSGRCLELFLARSSPSRAYRWGEDGLAGVSDDRQRLCFAVALWNGNDPILKERLFGLTNSESNHGEDVKEYYFYLDSTPTHSYMKYLYKYPQAAFPYADLVDTSRGRGRDEFEYELLDTGRVRRGSLFRRVRRICEKIAGRYADPNHRLQPRTRDGRLAPPADALVPQPVVVASGLAKPSLEQAPAAAARASSSGRSTAWRALPVLRKRCPAAVHRERNQHAADFGVANRTPYVKDGINNYVVNGAADAVNPEKTGTKAAAHYRLTVEAGESRVVRLRLSDVGRQARARPR